MNTFKSRQSIRLKKYDYSQSGWYFVTICTHDRDFLFGEIINGNMKLNDMGKIVHDVWYSLPDHHHVKLDVSQIMPNHIHKIIIIPSCRGFARKTPTFKNVTAGSLPCIIRSFKSEITKQIRRLTNKPEMIVWQRNYYEHIIRNEPEYVRICQYIADNPTNWETDQNNPKNNQ